MRPKSAMHAFQDRAVTRLYEDDEGLAIMDMGAGKTVTTLTAHRELIDAGEIDRAVVVAPRRVAASVWPNEPGQWEHLQDHRVMLVSGTPKQRLAKLLQPADTYVVGVENVPWFAEFLREQETDAWFHRIDFDEISRFRAPRSKRARSLLSDRRRRLPSLMGRFRQRWGLTGTPRPSSELDMFMPMRLLTNETLWGRDFDAWRRQHFIPDYNGHSFTIHPASRTQLNAEIAPYTFTVDPADLPPRPDVDQSHVVWVDLPPKARDEYKRLEKDFFAITPASQIIQAVNSGVMSGKLEQVVQGFLYAEKGAADSAQTLHTEKLDALRDIDEDAGGSPLLVCYKFAEDLAALRRALPGLRVIGAGTSDAEVEDIRRGFNAGEILRVALHPASGGHGLNMQDGPCRHVVWYCPTWSGELFSQTMARLARQGSKHKSIMSWPIMARDTIDELKHMRVNERMDAEAAFKEYVSRI